MKIEESIEIVQKEAEEIKNGKGLYYLYYDEKLDDRKRTAEAIETLLTAYEKEKEKNKKIEKELEKHIKFCEQEAEGSLNNEICHIALKFNKGLLDIINEEE